MVVVSLIVSLLVTSAPATSQGATEQLRLVPAADATIYSESGALGNGAGQHLFAGFTRQGAERRALLQFDLSQIPAGATIVSAQLELDVNMSRAATEPFSLFPVSNPWSEGATDAPGEEGQGDTALEGDTTWTHAELGGQEWTTPGGDFVARSSSQASLTEGPATFTGLGDDVSAMAASPQTSFGWILIGDNPDSQTAMRLGSRTGTGGPELVIEYVIEQAQPEPDPEPVPVATCRGLEATIDHSDAAGPVTIRGTSGADVIVGSRFADQIDGRRGADVICGGRGNDRITGGNGADVLVGGNGRDDLRGGGGADLLIGGRGNDDCRGNGSRNDVARGCENRRTIP